MAEIAARLEHDAGERGPAPKAMQNPTETTGETAGRPRAANTNTCARTPCNPTGTVLAKCEAAVKLSRLPLTVWVPLASGVAIGVPGLIALLTHHLILFASLGPTSVMVAQQPLLASTRPYNAVVGHMIGLGAGFFAVWVLGIAAAPSVFVAHMVSGPRVGAALLAIAVATALELLLKAQHPPGAATTLLAALGSFRLDWTDTWEVLVGVLAVTLTGELLRMLHPAPPAASTRAA